MRYITEEQEHEIKSIMYKKRIHVMDLPKLIGYSRPTWSLLLCGKRAMDAEQIIRLSRLLGLSKQQTMDYLLDFSLFPEIEEKV